MVAGHQRLGGLHGGIIVRQYFRVTNKVGVKVGDNQVIGGLAVSNFDRLNGDRASQAVKSLGIREVASPHPTFAGQPETVAAAGRDRLRFDLNANHGTGRPRGSSASVEIAKRADLCEFL